LLDAGEPCAHTLKRRDVSFDSIDAIFITHMYSDHIGGLPMLLQSMWLEQRRRPLTIFLPFKAIAPFRKWLQHCLLDERRFGYRIQWKPVRPMMRVGNVTVRAYRNSHLDKARARYGKRHPEICFDAFSFVLETDTPVGTSRRLVRDSITCGRAGGSPLPKTRIAYSGDIGALDDLTPLLPVEVLIVELAHTKPVEMFRWLDGKPIERVLISHVGRGVTRRSHGTIRFVRDGECYRV
jgi:ribonuclease BN (tRNA processing enzyme)